MSDSTRRDAAFAVASAAGIAADPVDTLTGGAMAIASTLNAVVEVDPTGCRALIAVRSVITLGVVHAAAWTGRRHLRRLP